MLKFEQVRVLGQGGFGKAILARRKDDKTLVVIKEVQLTALKPRDRDVAFQEAKLLAKLHHPFIVSYVDSFQENGNLYIVMEYADGGDLAQKLQKKNGQLMSEEEVLHYFFQIALAIKYIHDRRILHRDLKTQNIFLTKDGTVKLGDFGIARVLQHTFQLCKTQIGTPYYLSPEICEGKNYNSKTDIWSLGCILYELLTLRKAFDANNMNQLLVKIIRGKHPPISSNFSSDIRQLVDSMLTKDPSKRPSINQILYQPFIKARLSYEMESTILSNNICNYISPPNKPENNIKNEKDSRNSPKSDKKSLENDKVVVKNANINNNVNINKNANQNKKVNREEYNDKLERYDRICREQLHKDIQLQLGIEDKNDRGNDDGLTPAQRKQKEYEEKLQQAKERRERRLKQEAEEKLRQEAEQRRKEIVKQSLQENNERDLIRLPGSPNKKKDEIDAAERRRIYLEQKEQMLRNKRRYEHDTSSILKDVYGDEPYSPSKQINFKRPTSNIRKKAKNDDDNQSNNKNDRNNQFGNKNVKKNRDSNIRNKNVVDMKEFYRQQRREANENKKRLQAAIDGDVDFNQLVNKAEEEIVNDGKSNRSKRTPRSANASSSSRKQQQVNRQKQQEINVEFFGTPKKTEQNASTRRNHSSYESEQKAKENEKNQQPKIEPPPQRSPSETRGRHLLRSTQGKIELPSPEKSIQLDKSNTKSNSNFNEAINSDEYRIEAEKKMNSAMEKMNAIQDVLNMNTNESDLDANDDTFGDTNEIDDDDFDNEIDPYTKNDKNHKKNSNQRQKNNHEISETTTFYFGNQETVDFPVVKDSDSLAYRAEAIRAFLEQEIGIDKLIGVYRAISEGTDEEAARMSKDIEYGYIVLIQQLLILDEQII
ncbi:CAMK family protein kinase [Tritrichomonas foetus]|uniref:non-specific serine/threonine protein kinase n=1 Tax=Tritrichomonas foetus TaxID=1144522 RepID=A0A1J4KZD1_9EUKA|nr:CAMK family protein kinase [Tritrichomonas foetus]|eukprot:OHT16615.1 CAMK family protein kinase [Tritrichomonas foetus]